MEKPVTATSKKPFVKDLGMAAYLKMQGFALAAKEEGKGFIFEVKAEDVDEFNRQKIQYVNSPYATFDGEIMNLKKL